MASLPSAKRRGEGKQTLCTLDKFTVFENGGTDNSYVGVAFIVNSRIYVTKVLSDEEGRILRIDVASKRGYWTFVNCYAPTNMKSQAI